MLETLGVIPLAFNAQQVSIKLQYMRALLTQDSTDAGEEIYATYGGHSNDKLLVHYGFVCESTMQHASPDDEIRIDHMILPHLSEATKAQLQDVGFLGGYALLPSEYTCRKETRGNNEIFDECEANCRQPWDICFKTQVAVRAELLTANEWEYFVSCGEDLSGDKSAAVGKWLHPLLQQYNSDALKRFVDLNGRGEGETRRTVEHLEADGHGLALQLLGTRWNQHMHAIGGSIGTLVGD